MNSSRNQLFDNIFEEGDDNSSLSSFLSGDIHVSDEVIKEKIENILQNVFSDHIKQKVETFSNRYNFSCPYCLDSSKNANNKRGNLFFRNKWYKCFNCFTTKPLYRLFLDFKDVSKISEIDIVYLRNQNTEIIASNKIHFDLLDKTVIDKYALTREFIREKMNFIDVSDDRYAYKYLSSRFLTRYDIFDYSPDKNAIIIYNMNESGNIVGYITRNLSEYAKSRYFSYKISKIYEEIGLEYDDDIQEVDLISNVFNIYKIDFNETITIFEGVIDSLFCPNAIGISGITKSLPFDIEYIQYWLDNDESGIDKTLRLLEQGYPVFLWKKYLNDMNINVKIKDLNELYVYCKKNNLEMIRFKNYFSKDKLDVYWL